jgi:hypothetical protein
MRWKNHVIPIPTYSRVLLGKVLYFGYTKIGAGKIPSRFHQDFAALWTLTSPAMQNACCTATKDLISLIVPVL